MVSQLVEPSQADLEEVADTAASEAMRLNNPSMDSNVSGLRSMSYTSEDDPVESMDISEADPLALALPESEDSEFIEEFMPADLTAPRRSDRASHRGENPGCDG